MTPRRGLVNQDQLDIPLIRSDGSLHVVELKQANVPALIGQYRNHYIVGKTVNEAVGQTMNYLRALDEQRAQILADFKVDTRRASATVVVGYTPHVNAEIRDGVQETIRSYSAQLARIEVITYDDLIESGRRSLALDT